MLNINTEENGTEITILLEGKVDTTTAPQLREEMYKYIDSFDLMIMDLKDMAYVSSAGLRVFLEADQDLISKNKKLKFINVPKSVMDVFDMTGFSNVLTIE